MNDVALCANDVLRNDVGLRPTMLRFAQTERYPARRGLYLYLLGLSVSPSK